MSVLNISENLVQHCWIKLSDIRHQFTRKPIEQKKVVLEHIMTENLLEDIFAKLVDTNEYEKLRSALGCCITNL